MPVRVCVTYDMSKVLGASHFETEASNVGEAVAATRTRFGADTDRFDELTARTALAVNGVLVRFKKRLATTLSDGDTVTFVKAAAGG